MKPKLIKDSIMLLMAGIMLFAIASCSEEIVLIEEEDRSALDSLDVLISVITDDLTASKIAKNALTRRLDSLNDAIDAAAGVTGSNADVHYTVQVTNGSQAYMGGRVSSLTNAIVTVSQGNVTKEITTDATGMATFPELESGFISVTVEIADFSDVYMIVDLRDGGVDSNGTNADTRYASTQVMVFPTSGSDMFTISGTSYYNQNLDNQRADTQTDPLHPYTGSEIYERLPSGIRFYINCVPTTITNNTAGRSGQIVQAVYAGLSRVTTTDTNGDWILTLPVVFLTNDTNLFNYVGPYGDNISGTQTSVIFGDTQEIWFPSTFYPNNLNEISFFPGGNSVQDLYYFPI